MNWEFKVIVGADGKYRVLATRGKYMAVHNNVLDTPASAMRAARTFADLKVEVQFGNAWQFYNKTQHGA